MDSKTIINELNDSIGCGPVAYYKDYAIFISMSARKLPFQAYDSNKHQVRAVSLPELLEKIDLKESKK
ncbi:MAG: hypothetical protein WC389_13820 [Lutibacter sp.]|jgi:hypothetical protein